MKGARNIRDWRERMKEMLDANPKENDSLELGDSWSGMPRPTEVLANRSNHLYRRHLDPEMQSTQNLYNVIMVKRSTQENAPIKEKNNVSPTGNDATPSSSTPDNIVTEETTPNSFTEFLRSNHKTNMQITSTPYVALNKAHANQLPINDEVLPPEVPCTPGKASKSLQRPSFHISRNNESYDTSRLSRVSVNIVSNLQVISPRSREPVRELHVDVIPNNNQSGTGIAIVSSTASSRENLMTSDEDCETQPVFLKPPDNVQFRNPQIVPLSSQINVPFKTRSQIYALQNEGQPSTDQPTNSIQNTKQKQESHHDVEVSAKEYLKLMQTHASNAQQSDISTASSTRRKLYKKGSSIHADNDTIIASQKASVEFSNKLRSEHPVTSQVKEISPLSIGMEKTVPSKLKYVVNSLENPINGKMDKFQTDIIIQANNGRTETWSPKKGRRRRLRSENRTVNIEPVTNEVGKEKLSNKSAKSPTHSETPTNTEQNGAEKKIIMQLSKEVDKNKLSTKSRKRASSNAPLDIEQDVQPNDIAQSCDEVIAQLPIENRESSIVFNDLHMESEQDNFETSDIQPSNEVDTEINKSGKRPTHSKSSTHTEQNDSDTESITQSSKKVEKKQLSKKSKKRPAFSKHSQVRTKQNSAQLILVNKLNTEVAEVKLAKKSRKRPLLVDNEQDIEPIAMHDELDVESMAINNELDVEQFSNESRPTPSNDMPETTEQDNFETSDIQQIQEVKENDNKSRKHQRNAKKQPLHVDEPPPKKSRQTPLSKRTNPEENESSNDGNQANNENDEHYDPKPKKKKGARNKFMVSEVKYDALKEREIAPGARHSTRTRRLPDTLPSIPFLLEKLKKTRKVNKGASSLKKKKSVLQRPKEVVHTSVNCLCASLLNDESQPLDTLEFQGVRITKGYKSVTTDALTAHYLQSSEDGRSVGWMTLLPNSTKKSSRCMSDLWMLVISGSTDLVINNEFQTLTIGSVVHLKINTKYSLKNNNEHQTLIMFSQDIQNTK